MAATITVPAKTGAIPSAPIFVDRVRIVAGAADNYVTGGILVTKATNLPGKTVIDAIQVGKTTTGYIAIYDRATDRVKLMTVGGAAGSVTVELANTTAINNEAIEMLFFSE